MKQSMFDPSDTYLNTHPHNVPLVKSPVLRNVPQSKRAFMTTVEPEKPIWVTTT